jgi:hypothetical protein
MASPVRILGYTCSVAIKVAAVAGANKINGVYDMGRTDCRGTASTGEGKPHCEHSDAVGGEVSQDSPDVKAKTVKPSELVALIQQQGYRCALTGVLLEPKRAALDHKMPVCMGGTHEASNLQWIDHAVNKAKHTMTNEEFIEMCRRVVAYAS